MNQIQNKFMSINQVKAYTEPVILSLCAALYGKLSSVYTSLITALILDITGFQQNMELFIHNVVLISGAATSVTGFGYMVFKFYRDYRDFKNLKR